MNIAVIIGTYSLLTIASLYLLIRNRVQYLVYSLVLVLAFGSVVGSLFKILHLPGADELLLTGFAGTFLGAILLLWRSFRNRQGQILFYKLMTALILVSLVAFVVVWPGESRRIALLNYPLTAFLGTILINEQYEHEGERNLIILFLLHGFLYIVIDVLKLF